MNRWPSADAKRAPLHRGTVTETFSDAPKADEIVVIFAFATRGRLHARPGGLKVSPNRAGDGLRQHELPARWTKFLLHEIQEGNRI